MITKIHVKNFKSFSDFAIEGMGNRVYLIGLNGSGKTTFLQLLEFMSALMRKSGLDWRIGGEPVTHKDLLNAGSARKTIDIDATVRLDEHEYRWTIAYNAQEGTVTEEKIAVDGTPALHYRGKYLKAGGISGNQQLSLPGSALCYYTSNAGLNRFRQHIIGIQGIGVLNPMSIAAPVRDVAKKAGIEPDGRNLPVVLDRLSKEQKDEFRNTVLAFYGESRGIQGFQPKSRQFGWRRLFFTELDKAIDAVHLSYGTLRYMVIAALRYSSAPILFIDEIENGVSQEGMRDLAALLDRFGDRQLFVTTHSVLFLNYLDDGQARDGIYLLQRTPENGPTLARRFFRDIPGKDIALQHLNPGEAVSITNLREVPLPSTPLTSERP